MATVAQLLGVLKVAVAGQTHHKSLGVVKGGGLAGLHHVELLQLEITENISHSSCVYSFCENTHTCTHKHSVDLL